METRGDLPKSAGDFNDEDAYAYHIKRFLKGRGYKKIWNYFSAVVVKNESFQATLKKLRSKYGIPPSGFPWRSIPGDELKAWKFTDNITVKRRLRRKAEKLCDKVGLNFIPWADHVLDYIFYNRTEERGDVAAAGSLCLFIDVAADKKDPLTKDIQVATDKYFPFSIRFSPYASERDILDFVRLSYKVDIKPSQDDYISTMHTIKPARYKGKKASVADRDDFIFRNRHLPQKEIKTRVKEKFGVSLDYPYIGKIVSRERKRRQIV